jgi:hypothetical protein
MMTQEEVLPAALRLAETLADNAFEPSRFVLLSMRSTKVTVCRKCQTLAFVQLQST